MIMGLERLEAISFATGNRSEQHSRLLEVSGQHWTLYKQHDRSKLFLWGQEGSRT